MALVYLVMAGRVCTSTNWDFVEYTPVDSTTLTEDGKQLPTHLLICACLSCSYSETCLTFLYIFKVVGMTSL